MKEKKGRILTATAAAVLISVFFICTLAYAFRQYMDQIVSEQEEQLLNIARAVSNSISLYTDFYFQDLQKMSQTSEYQDAGENFLETGNADLLTEFFQSQMELQREDVEGILLRSLGGADGKWDGDGTVFCGPERSYESVYCLKGTEPGTGIDVLEDKHGTCYLSLSVLTLNGKFRLCYIIDIQEMYDRVGSYMKVGDNGYVMIKDSSGRILMHPVEEQLGINVIDGREQMYPDFDLSELEEMISHQLQGAEGVEIYHSYWWADDPPSPVRKICAYTPVWFADDFLIVAAVIDYSEIETPVIRAAVSVFLLAVILVSMMLYTIFRFGSVAKARKTAEQENQRLRELNAKLEQIRAKEEKLAHDQRLQLMGTLTGGIAHEFNNLLTPIMGYSGMILMEAEPDSEMADSAGEIYQAAERAKEIIRQIAAMSRKQAGALTKPLLVGEAMDGIMKMLTTVKPDSVRLETEFSWPPDCLVCYSETELNQILLNLSTNGFHAMKEKEGTLTVGGRAVPGEEAAPYLHGKKAASRYLLLYVRDTGAGIPKDHLEHIFDPFYTTKETGEGTGLGLSVVQNILESRNGGIHVESKEGEGSCFCLYLPIWEQEKASGGLKNRELRRKERKGGAERILLVEDDRKILRMLTKGLRGAGYEVRGFGNPKEAAENMREESFDVLVTDYSMPEMSGIQLADLAERCCPGCRTLVITGLADEALMEAYESRKVDRILLKPLECETLLEAIESGRLSGQPPMP